jgi:hypothetical protein
MGFVVDKAALTQVFSEYFGAPAKHSIDCSTPSSSGADKISQ